MSFPLDVSLMFYVKCVFSVKRPAFFFFSAYRISEHSHWSKKKGAVCCFRQVATAYARC